MCLSFISPSKIFLSAIPYLKIDDLADLTLYLDILALLIYMLTFLFVRALKIYVSLL